MSDKQFNFKIISENGIVFDDFVLEASLPTDEGSIVVLPGHTPLVSSIKEGEIILNNNGVKRAFAIWGGLLDVRASGEVVLMSDYGEESNSISLKEAQEAKRRAEKILSNKDEVEEVDFVRAEAMLQRELFRIALALRRK